MRVRFVHFTPLLAAILFLTFTNGCAAVPIPEQESESEAESESPAFDPRDLSGIWRLSGGRGVEPAPPMTPAGLALHGRRLSDREAGSPSLSNDPIYACNPQGFPRLVYDENESGLGTVTKHMLQ